MEQKKFDSNSILGFVLISGILIWMLYFNKPTEEEIQAEQAKKEAAALEAEKNKDEDIQFSEAAPRFTSENAQDSLAFEQLRNRLGSFAYSETTDAAQDHETILENDVLFLKVSNKGGYITEARLKQHTRYDSIPIYLIRDNNSFLNLRFGAENRTLNTRDLYFEPELFQNGEDHILSMKLKASENAYIEYRYTLHPGEYMMDFGISSRGLDGILDSSQPMELEWELTGYRQAKSISYENRYTRLTYEYEGNKHSKLSPSGNDSEQRRDVSWMNFRQHFFSSMLLTDTPFKEVNFSSENLVHDEKVDTVYTKKIGRASCRERV